MFGTLGISNEKLTKRPGKNRNMTTRSICSISHKNRRKRFEEKSLKTSC